MDSREKEKRKIFRALLPARVELIALPLFSLVILVSINSFRFLRTVDGKNYSLVSEYAQTRFREALGYLDEILGSTIPLMIFWMFIGVFVYTLIWLGVSAWKTWREDLPPDGSNMVVPKNYSHQSAIQQSLLRIMVRIIASILLISWIVMFFVNILPWASTTFLYGSTDIKESWLCIVATITLAGALFIISVLARCVVLRTRVLGGDSE